MNSGKGLRLAAAVSPISREFFSDSSTAEAAVTMRVARTIEEVEALRGIWSGWKSHRDSDIDFCQEFVWSGEEFIRPHVIVIYRHGCPEALLVGRLEHTRMASRIGYLRFPGIPVRLLTFANGGFLGNPSAENSEEFIKSIIDALRYGEADVALLHQARTDTPIYKGASSLPGFATRDRLAKPTVHNVMRLPENVDQVYLGLSSGLRAEVRRKKRKVLADFGDSVKVQCFRDRGNLEKVIADAEEVAKKTYQRGLDVGFRDTEGMRRRLKFCAEKGWLRAYLVTISDKPCAFWVGTVYDGVFCSDYNGYDPEFRDYSIGTFLLITMIEDFCREGVKAIDFGIGQAEYKSRFGNEQWMESSVYIFAPTLKGLVLNAVRTTTGLIDAAIRKTMESTKLLPKLKRLWRARLTKHTAGTTP